MDSISRYILKQLAIVTLFITLGLTFAVWLTQSLRLFEYIVNRGLPASTFLGFVGLLLPSFLGVVLPIAAFCAVLFNYNKMIMDSEMVVMRAAGISHLQLARPAIVLGIAITAVVYAITLYFLPLSYRAFKDIQYELRNDYAMVLLQEGVFNTLGDGITVYVRERTADGELQGILVHDNRDPATPVTMMAARGALIRSEAGPRVVMVNGNRQEVNRGEGKLSLLNFDRYTIELSEFTEAPQARRFGVKERFLGQLFWPDDVARDDLRFRQELRAEGHRRLSAPLYTLSFVFIGLVALLSGEFNRRGQIRRILLAILCVGLLEGLTLALHDLSNQSPQLSSTMYLAALLPVLICIYMLMAQPTKKTPRQAPVGGAASVTRPITSPRMRRLQMSTTLTWYIARQFSIVWFSFFLAIAAIILLVSLVDLLDRFGGREGVGLGVIFEMSFLKLPNLSLEILPFTLLFAGLATFWQLTRTHELVVARAAGVSVWQFLLPVLLVAIAAGGITVTALNPVAATLLARYELVEARFSRSGPRSELAVSRTGLWLRQADQDGQAVIHAARLLPDGITLQDVIVFRLNTDDRFLERVDAERAELGVGQWHLTNAWVSGPGKVPGFVEGVAIETALTPAKIQESFADPQTISFWSLPGFIQLLEESGFSSVRHKLQLNKLLATPLLFAAMVLLAATFSLRPQRRGKVGIVILSGMLAGFLLYFFSNFVFALGMSAKIPVVLAGWAPAGASMMLGIAMLLHLEDG